MATTLQSIPAELLDNIMGFMTIPEVINLWRSNSAFSRRASVKLFGNSKARDCTMFRACTDGDVDLIRAAISHGANPSYFNMLTSGSKRKTPSVSKRVSTLGLAAQFGHNELFAVLLELGARIDKIAKKQRRAIVMYLRAPESKCHIKPLLDSGVNPESLGGPAFIDMLATYMKQQSTTEFLDYMARGGADLAELAKIGHCYRAETCSAPPAAESDTRPDNSCAASTSDVKSVLPKQDPGCATNWWFSDLPSLEVLLDKWGLEAMEDPHFSSFMTYLLQQGIGREKYGSLLDTYCWDYPTERIETDCSIIEGCQIKNLPAWWDFVEVLLDKVRVESKSKGPCHWVAEILPERFDISHYNADCLAGILSEQEAKDGVLYELVGNQLVWVTCHINISRLILTRLIEDGANINARRSLDHPTALQAFCLPILRMTFDTVIQWHNKERYNWRCVKTEAAILMLIDKGSDPYAELEGLTVIQRLNVLYKDDQPDRITYFEGLTKEMKEARERFLANGSTPNHLDPRNVILLPQKHQPNAAPESGSQD